MQHYKPKIVANHSNGRFKGREIDAEALAIRTSTKAQKTNDWTVELDKNTDVPWGHGVTTECALALSDPHGLTVVWVGRCNATLDTSRGMAEACVEGSGAIWDRRIKKQTKIDAAWALLKERHEKSFTPIEKLAAAAE